MRTAAALALAAALAATSASAEGFSISDLGAISNVDRCLDKAERVFLAAGAKQQDIYRESWNAMVYDIQQVGIVGAVGCVMTGESRRAILTM